MRNEDTGAQERRAELLRMIDKIVQEYLSSPVPQEELSSPDRLIAFHYQDPAPASQRVVEERALSPSEPRHRESTRE